MVRLTSNTPKLVISKVQITDVVRRPCSVSRHVMAPYKLHYLLVSHVLIPDKVTMIFTQVHLIQT